MNFFIKFVTINNAVRKQIKIENENKNENENNKRFNCIISD